MKSRPILIAGFGSIGRRHYRNLTSLGFDNFIFFRNRLGAIDGTEIAHHRAFSRLEDALAEDPFITVVANPTALHLPVASAAAAAGSHLLVEKPISHTLDGVEELASECERRGLTNMVGCQWRFHPLLRALHKGIADGRLGEVLAVRVEFGEFLPGWHPWEDYRRAYSARADLGGGVVLTLIHPLDYLYWIFGEVGRVHASTRSAKFLATTAEDVAEITIEFQSGVIGQVHLDYVQRTPHHSVRVLGERGAAFVNLCANTLRWEIVDKDSQVERVPDGFERNTMFMDEMKSFLDAVQSGAPSSIPLREGHAVLSLALRAKEDAKRQ